MTPLLAQVAVAQPAPVGSAVSDRRIPRTGKTPPVVTGVPGLVLTPSFHRPVFTLAAAPFPPVLPADGSWRCRHCWLAALPAALLLWPRGGDAPRSVVPEPAPLALVVVPVVGALLWRARGRRGAA